MQVELCLPPEPYFSATPGCLQEDFKGTVVASQGFAYRPERPQAKGFVAQKWAWTGTQPGGPWQQVLRQTCGRARCSECFARFQSTHRDGLVRVPRDVVASQICHCAPASDCPRLQATGLRWSLTAGLRRP